MKKLVLIFVLFFSLESFGLSEEIVPDGLAKDYNLSVRTDRGVYSVGDSVEVTEILMNQGSGRSKITAYEVEWYKSVIKRGGVVVNFTIANNQKYAAKVFFALPTSWWKKVIEVGEGVKGQYELNDIADLSRPGNYTIEARRSFIQPGRTYGEWIDNGNVTAVAKFTIEETAQSDSDSIKVMKEISEKIDAASQHHDVEGMQMLVRQLYGTPTSKERRSAQIAVLAKLRRAAAKEINPAFDVTNQNNWPSMDDRKAVEFFNNQAAVRKVLDEIDYLVPILCAEGYHGSDEEWKSIKSELEIFGYYCEYEDSPAVSERPCWATLNDYGPIL